MRACGTHFSLRDVRAPLHVTGWKRDRVEKLGGSVVARSLPIGWEDLAPSLGAWRTGLDNA